MNPGFLIVLIILLFHSGQVFGLEVIRFETLPMLVKSRDKAIEARRQNQIGRKYREGFLIRSFLPEVESRLGFESLREGAGPTSNEPFWHVEGRINVFRGFQDYHQEKARKMDTYRSEAELQISEYERIYEARVLFWGILGLQKLIILQERAIDENENHLKQAKRKVSSGITTAADPLEFEMNRAILNQSLKELILELDFLKNNLAIILGIPNHKDLIIEGEFLHPPDNEMQSIVLDLEKNPNVKNLSAQKNQAISESKQFSAWWAPSLDLFSSYGQEIALTDSPMGSEYERRFLLGGRVTLNFFDAAENRRESRAKARMAHSIGAYEDLKKAELPAKLHELQHDLSLHHELIHGADETIAQAERFLKLTLNEYNRGIKNGPDVLQAANKRTELSQKAIHLARDYEIIKAGILRMTGE